MLAMPSPKGPGPFIAHARHSYATVVPAGSRGDPLPASGSFALRLVKSVRCCPVLVVKANSKGPYVRATSAALGEEHWQHCSALCVDIMDSINGQGLALTGNGPFTAIATALPVAGPAFTNGSIASWQNRERFAELTMTMIRLYHTSCQHQTTRMPDGVMPVCCRCSCRPEGDGGVPQQQPPHADVADGPAGC